MPLRSPALLWVQPSAPLIAGPSGNDEFPSIDRFLQTLFTAPAGAFQVVGKRFELEHITVDVAAPTPTEVFSDGRVTVRGIGVPHGGVPAVGYRVDVGDASLGFAGDQTGTRPAFAELMQDVDVLIAHFTASEQAEGLTAERHARPSGWGQVATDANAKSLLLSHIGFTDPANSTFPRSAGSNLEGNVAHLRSRYDGPVTLAEDLMCVAVD